MPAAYLPERSLIRLTGTDAQDFLQGLITTDIDGLPQGEARPGALLTPQGKILFDFLVWRDDGGFLIESDSSQRDALIRRLTMYKLRAAVELSAPAEDGVTVSWGDDAATGPADVRFAKAGVTLTRQPGRHSDNDDQAYQTLRIASGIVVSGADYALQDAFPHDVLLDLSGGLSFRKGCYVGQEVVSRMHHRGTARRRVALVTTDTTLPTSGTDITANGKTVGTLGSSDGGKGLAIVRIDRVGDAMASGTPLLAGEVEVTLALPGWSGLSFPLPTPEAEAPGADT